MRANEYIEMNKSSIRYLEDTKRVIADLLPLRKDKYATDEYYNRYLLTDWRYNLYQIDMRNYQFNNGNADNPPVLEKHEGEIPYDEAPAFRNQLFEIIKEDKSFGYLFYQLGVEKNQKNAFYKSKPIQCVPDDEVIIASIQRYRDDYPKNNLEDYIDDAFNYEQYCFLTENNLFVDNEELLLSFFNTTYHLYDQIRCLKSKPSKVSQHCTQFGFTNDIQKYWILSTIVKLIEEFENQDIQLDRCKKEIQKTLKSLENHLYPNGIEETKLQEAEEKTKKNIFTTSQQVLFFYYLLNEIGIHFGNSDKSQWIRFIHSFTGKNAQDIKEKLNFNFDEKKTQRDLRIITAYLEELMPAIAIKIKKDTQE